MLDNGSNPFLYTVSKLGWIRAAGTTELPAKSISEHAHHVGVENKDLESDCLGSNFTSTTRWMF